MRHASSLHLLLVLASSSLLRAQSPTWTLRTASPPSMDSVQMAYDLARGRSVLVAPAANTAVAGLDTWEWDGTNWLVRRPSVVPPARLIQTTTLAYDVVRARTVLFGGDPNNWTWEWDGVRWSAHTSVIAPSQRSGHRMAFHVAQARTVLFGGLLGNGLTSDETWEWDGFNWMQRFPAIRPLSRHGHGMVYDLSRNRIVLCGGRERRIAGGQLREQTLGDTWEWDGVNWTQRSPSHAPPFVDFPAMVFDTAHARTVLYAGTTWMWDGSDWTSLSLPTSPNVGNASAAGFVFDIQRQRAVLYGVSPGGSATPAAPLWEWDGHSWTDRTAPAARAFAAMAYADRRGSALLFGGLSGSTHLGDAWEWDGTSWSQRATASMPNARETTAIVYDSLRDRYVLFGGGTTGVGGTSTFGDTWEFDRSNWIQRASSPSPPARSWHAMAFDRNRGRVVLFGGVPSTSGLLGDTWEWNGSSWTSLAPAVAPPARAIHAMTFDPVHGRTLLFGGLAAVGRVNDFWQWDGSTWLQRTSAVMPPARRGHVMTWDAARARAVVIGGVDNGQMVFADAWEWDGTNWTQAAPGASPFATEGAAAAYDSQRGTNIVFGGRWTSQVEHSELWEYAIPGFAIASTFGLGCGTPPLSASPASGSRPVLGATQTIDIRNVPAGVAAMAYGFSMSALGTTPLPLDLGGIGLTGCSALQSSDRLFDPCASSGPAAATYSVSVPNVPGLLSLRVWLQAWAPAPGQNPAGLIASNAVSLLLGSQ
jgi:hypothetical protein